MATNDNKIKRGELIREECFIGIYNQRGELKAVVRKNVEGDGSPQIFTARKAFYSSFLEVLTMLATCAQRVVQLVEKEGITVTPLNIDKVFPNSSPHFPQDIHPTPRT